MTILIKKFNELNAQQLYEILKHRVDIFVVEQQCPYHELDDFDQLATHIWLEDNHSFLAYARVLPNNSKFEHVSIGRVISLQRRFGYGTQVLQAAIDYIKQTYDTDVIDIEAQVYAIPFYQSLGFKVIGNEFLEDNIPHVTMRYYY